jgi:hypothetical protein
MSDFLSLDEIRSETLVELPEREMLALVTIKYVNVVVPVFIHTGDIASGNQICAQALAALNVQSCKVSN